MKNISISFILLLVLIFQFPGCDRYDLPYLESPIPSLAGIQMEKNSEIERRYENTRCVKFLAMNKDIGLLCSSSSNDFMKDFGIIIDDEGKEVSSYVPHLKIATGLAIYDMKPAYISGRILYATETDCDEYNGPIYRATSTCHVVVMPLNKSEFIYSNFVIKNHVDSSVGIATQDIEDFWRRLKLPKNLNVIPAMEN